MKRCGCEEPSASPMYLDFNASLPGQLMVYTYTKHFPSNGNFLFFILSLRPTSKNPSKPADVCGKIWTNGEIIEIWGELFGQHRAIHWAM